MYVVLKRYILNELKIIVEMFLYNLIGHFRVHEKTSVIFDHLPQHNNDIITVYLLRESL